MAVDEASSAPDALHLVNRLGESRSPYVRGHQKNPVAWQMWDAEALSLAKKHNRMLFLSIGYAACHWCHVMERESFESPEVAELLNSNFIPIKIDREERPDIDAIYMNYVQATTGSGGWPLNVFVTPDLEPVFGGTYWPGPNNSMTAVGTAVAETIGFLDILNKMKMVWTQQEERCRASAKAITEQLRGFAEEGVHGHGPGTGERDESEILEIELLEEAYQHFEGRFDSTNGGFSSAPKFPTPVNLSFLLSLDQWPSTVREIVGHSECANATSMVITTLRAMARGGIRDQVGHGFARYSVTADWSLPHFEKMLYDQAQLLSVYLDAFLITHDAEMLGCVYDLATYLTAPPIAAPNGGFYSSEDADSLPSVKDTEKREGAYYVWTHREVLDLLGPRDAEVVNRFYGIHPDGNVPPNNDPHDEFMNQNVLRITTTPVQLAKDLALPEATILSTLKSARLALRTHRETHRPRPALDDKIILSWNALAISALARTAAALSSIDKPKSTTCLAAALDATAFLRRELYDADTKTLYRIYSQSARGAIRALCDDYAFLIAALLDLYEATFDDSHLQWAEELQLVQMDQFRDKHHPAGFYTTASSSSLPSSSPHHPSDLLLRLKPGMDAAEPSANSVSARNLYRLGSMLGDEVYTRAARGTVQAFEAEIAEFPYCFAGMLGGVVVGGLGVRGVVLFGGGGVEGKGVEGKGANGGEGGEGAEGGEDGKDGEGVDEEEVWKRVWGKVVPGRTVVRVGGVEGRGAWLRGRNEALRGLKDGEEAGVMVCEGGRCRHGWGDP